MPETIIITPVKDSLETTKKTIKAISETKGDFEYVVFNDFCLFEAKLCFKKQKSTYGFRLICLEDISTIPSLHT